MPPPHGTMYVGPQLNAKSLPKTKRGKNQEMRTWVFFRTFSADARM